MTSGPRLRVRRERDLDVDAALEGELDARRLLPDVHLGRARAREARHALVAAGRFDLLRCVLRGPNAEARAYAAHALLERQLANADDSAAIETLARLPLPLTTCAGCEVYETDWEKALARLRER